MGCPRLGVGDLSRAQPILRLQAWLSRLGESDLPIVWPDAESFFELVTCPTRRISSRRGDPSQLPIEVFLLGEYVGGVSFGLARPEFDQLAVTMLYLCSDLLDLLAFGANTRRLR